MTSHHSLVGLDKPEKAAFFVSGWTSSVKISKSSVSICGQIWKRLETLINIKMHKKEKEREIPIIIEIHLECCKETKTETGVATNMYLSCVLPW